MSEQKPLILVTNDDGITSHGIRTLVDLMKQLGSVVVVAPNSPQSGMGHAITIANPIRLYPSDIFGDVPAYECSGTPADCVKLAKHHVLKDRSPDLVSVVSITVAIRRSAFCIRAPCRQPSKRLLKVSRPLAFR